MSDKEFTARLRNFLAFFSEGLPPIVPVIRKNGVIDRDRTLALPCYQNFKRD